MLVAGSANADVGIGLAWETLRAGGSALDAVEVGIRAVEDNPADHTVGYGGYPNIDGQVELDASVMEGTRRQAGAVGGLRGYRAAVTVARAVLEQLPHVLVVGDGAARLAHEIGLPTEDLLTPEAELTWREGLTRIRQSPQGESTAIEAVRDVIGEIFDPERALQPEPVEVPPGGTVNLIAVDADGHLASAVSTSGWAWKYPGRIGDTPVIGAGNYCDDRYGAATCTGWGELTIRAGTARAVVAGLAAGLDLDEACSAAIRDLAGLETGEPGGRGYVNLIAVDAAGNHCALTTKPGTEYVWRVDGMEAARREARTVVMVGPVR
ncbi:MAG TPA: N(4)-(beta-N-acetylglucosaminyl)-L-asparaginase [Jatrophihabitantaceae bacterium]|jgi:beta-aspartyl-peptidase (threonine type)